MIKLNDRPCLAKSSKEDVIFGDNVIFLGDFSQLPYVSPNRVYRSKPSFQKGCDLRRSLNAAVILKRQMRRAEDSHYAQLLHRLRLQTPTQEDIELLNSDIEAPVHDTLSTSIILPRHELRHHLNTKRLRLFAEESGTPITYSVANVKSRTGIALSRA